MQVIIGYMNRWIEEDAGTSTTLGAKRAPAFAQYDRVFV